MKQIFLTIDGLILLIGLSACSGSASSNPATQGVGSGLTISQAIIQAHGGSLQVDSPGVNQGSTFTVSLPVVA